MSAIRHHHVSTNGTTLHVAEAGTGPLVLLLHGWPECWYSWRHQIPALVEAGYRVLAPDLRGFGESGQPEPVESYRMVELLGDLSGLLDAFGEQQAAVVGHDWGAAIAWNYAALRPERVRAVVGMSVPHMGRAPVPPTQLFRALFGGAWYYMLYFQAPGVAEAEFEADIERTLRATYTTTEVIDPGAPINRHKRPGDGFLTGVTVPRQLPGWINEEELAYFVSTYRKSGFRGGLNRYRNMDRDWADLPALETTTIEQPALFLQGENDPVRSFAPPEAMKALVPRLQGPVYLPGAGHWLQQERPAEVNAALLSFLAALPR